MYVVTKSKFVTLLTIAYCHQVDMVVPAVIKNIAHNGLVLDMYNGIEGFVPNKVREIKFYNIYFSEESNSVICFLFFKAYQSHV